MDPGLEQLGRTSSTVFDIKVAGAGEPAKRMEKMLHFSRSGNLTSLPERVSAPQPELLSVMNCCSAGERISP